MFNATISPSNHILDHNGNMLTWKASDSGKNCSLEILIVDSTGTVCT